MHFGMRFCNHKTQIVKNERSEMLNREEALLIVIDVQGRLARIVADSELVIGQMQKLIKGIKLLDIPIVLTNQVPEKLGSTIDEIACLLPGLEQISRTSFSILGENKLVTKVNDLNRKQIILCGFEAHICLYQSALDLIKTGFEVFFVVDCVSSRLLSNKDVAIQRVMQAGAKLTTVEMVLFELVRDVRNPVFKEISKIIK